jgi:hypothetical protein
MQNFSIVESAELVVVGPVKKVVRGGVAYGEDFAGNDFDILFEYVESADEPKLDRWSSAV